MIVVACLGAPCRAVAYRAVASLVQREDSDQARSQCSAETAAAECLEAGTLEVQTQEAKPYLWAPAMNKRDCETTSWRCIELREAIGQLRIVCVCVMCWVSSFSIFDQTEKGKQRAVIAFAPVLLLLCSGVPRRTLGDSVYVDSACMRT
jgi:hypothetical protein